MAKGIKRINTIRSDRLENLTKNAKKLLEERYLLEDETPGDMSYRVAKTIAKAEEEGPEEYWRKEFFYILNTKDFIPNSPCLMNAGTPVKQYSACNVLPIDDDMEAIFETVKNQALVTKSGAGTGFAFSRLRPKGDNVGKTGGTSSGVVSFMRVFDESTNTVKQGGRRKGM